MLPTLPILCSAGRILLSNARTGNGFSNPDCRLTIFENVGVRKGGRPWIGVCERISAWLQRWGGQSIFRLCHQLVADMNGQVVPIKFGVSVADLSSLSRYNENCRLRQVSQSGQLG